MESFEHKRIKELEGALEDVLRYVQLEGEPRMVHAVYIPYLQQLRNAASDYELKEKVIHRARSLLAKT